MDWRKVEVVVRVVGAALLGTGIEGPRECLGGLAEYVDGRGVVSDFAFRRFFGAIGVTNAGFGGGLADFSENGGEGGVGASDGPEEELDLAGGVVQNGDDVVLDGEFAVNGESGISMACRVGFCRCCSRFCSAFRSFSLVMSASIFKSDSSSLRR